MEINRAVVMRKPAAIVWPVSKARLSVPSRTLPAKLRIRRLAARISPSESRTLKIIGSIVTVSTIS